MVMSIYFNYLSIIFQAVGVVLDFVLSFASSRGKFGVYGGREAVPYIAFLIIILALPQTAVAVFGFHMLFTSGTPCMAPYNHQVVFVYIVGFVMCLGFWILLLLTLRCVKTYSSSSYTLFCKVLFCCCVKRQREQDSVYFVVGKTMAHLFNNPDITPTALSLVRFKQRSDEHARSLDFHSSNDVSSKALGVTGKGDALQILESVLAGTTATHVTISDRILRRRALLHHQRGPKSASMDFSDTVTVETLVDLNHYAPYAEGNI